MNNLVVTYRVEDRGYKTPCWIWPSSINRGGYVNLSRGGKKVSGHKWFYEQANGPVPKGLELDHLCRVRCCVNPAHMEPVTPLINVRRSATCKIDASIARAIVERADAGEPYDQIARDFGVSRALVCLISRGKSWKELRHSPSPHRRIKLTSKKVNEIRKRRADGERVVDLASELNMHPSYIGAVCRGSRWNGD